MPVPAACAEGVQPTLPRKAGIADVFLLDKESTSL